MQVEKNVFISYRRTNSFMALAVYQDLTKHGYDVFFDYNSINSGDFEQVIVGNIKSRAHFIVILTPSALERCDDPNDWLRREIEIALDEKRNIVPLMFEAFDYGSPSILKHLTGKLALLKRYNAQKVPVEFFEEAMVKIRTRHLNIPLGGVLHPCSLSVEMATDKSRLEADKEEIVTKEALEVEEWVEKGAGHLAAKDYTDAIADLSEAIHLKSDHIDAYVFRSLAYFMMGEYTQGEKDFTEAIRLNPDNAEAYWLRGCVYHGKGDYEQGIKDFTEALRLNPDYIDAYYYRAVTYHKKGDFEQAIEDYSQVISFEPNHSNAHYHREEACHKTTYDFRDPNSTTRGL